jgi:hypothetical protein
MDEVISIQVRGQEEGERLIQYLGDKGTWVSPFVYSSGDNSLIVKAAIPLKELEAALIEIRK